MHFLPYPVLNILRCASSVDGIISRMGRMGSGPAAGLRVASITKLKKKRDMQDNRKRKHNTQEREKEKESKRKKERARERERERDRVNTNGYMRMS